MLSNELFMNRCLDQGANIPLQIPARSMPTVYAIRPTSKRTATQRDKETHILCYFALHMQPSHLHLTG